MLDPSTRVKAAFCDYQLFYLRVLQVMASDEGNFPGPRCKNANISTERLMDGDVRKLSCEDFTKGILYELNQYRKATDVHFVGVCSFNCTHASTRAYYARVQSSVHEKNTHALTLCTNCARAFIHVYDSRDLPYSVHSRFLVFHYCPCHTQVVHTIVTTLWKIIVSSILSK